MKPMDSSYGKLFFVFSGVISLVFCFVLTISGKGETFFIVYPQKGENIILSLPQSQVSVHRYLDYSMLLSSFYLLFDSIF
ncbi:hypothetical protein M6B38_190985 [Iris pallida]|uniref:Uncharacterized protein n=1 Tax=Iris pallida TaxID=29817 RepID=A0AAX6EFE0_IRIPA|nr:hypothetical protein M6B38_190985 [Iris pallida]